MKKLLLYGFSGLLLLLTSCVQTPTEDNAIGVNEKGIALINAGKYEEALQAFLKAIKNPVLTKKSKGTIYRNIAITYNQLEKTDSAIHFSTLAAKCYKKNSFNYLVNAADVDLLRGKTDVALAKLLRAADLEPDEMSVNNTLGLIYMGEYDAAHTDLDKALQYNLTAFETNGGRIIEEVLARNYYNMENYTKAALHYEHLIQNYPDMISYSLNMGMTKHKLKMTKEAEQLFDFVLTKDSSYKETIDIFKEHN
ncbi:MAG: tetratricopeptide repeat protein [Ferruginibacter sp.]|nr:tetratricopeptide repeat protein [Chitinophagaceae bacterium]